jgi:hypothetical protein
MLGIPVSFRFQRATWAGVCAALLLAAACTGRSGGSGGVESAPGDAQFTVRSSEGTEARDMRLGSGTNEVQITPVIAGVLTATFVNQDPLFTLQLRVDTNRVTQGDRIVWPLAGWTDNDVRVNCTFDGRTYSSDRPGATGEVYFQTLVVTDNSTDFRAVLQMTMDNEVPTTLTLDGYLEVLYGQF